MNRINKVLIVKLIIIIQKIINMEVLIQLIVKSIFMIKKFNLADLFIINK